MKIDYIDPNNYGIVHTVLDESSTGIMLESYKGNSPSSMESSNKLLGRRYTI